MNKTYYVVGDTEYITATSIEEAINEWYDSYCDIEELTEFLEVEVNVYVKRTISPFSEIFEWNIENLIESLDENYGYEETYGDYGLSNEAKELYNKFIQQVIKEYPVSQLRCVDKIRVVVKEYLYE